VSDEPGGARRAPSSALPEPAIEASWKPTVGVIIGARVITAARNTAGTITRVVAINLVH
jgi:hypothetical protein